MPRIFISEQFSQAVLPPKDETFRDNDFVGNPIFRKESIADDSFGREDGLLRTGAFFARRPILSNYKYTMGSEVSKDMVVLSMIVAKNGIAVIIAEEGRILKSVLCSQQAGFS